MNEDFDKRQMMDILVDPNVSVILSELEYGEKDSIYLTEKLQISENEIKSRLSYVTEHGFVIMRQDGKNTSFSVDTGKLNKIMEADENFASVVDGLTELDQFLN
ncbi:MAG: helix-turn-helix transcriptional regulator [Nitrosotalea sp.]